MSIEKSQSPLADAEPVVIGDELFPRITPAAIQAITAGLVCAMSRQASEDLGTTDAFKWDSQEGLLYYVVRGALADCNKKIAVARKMAAAGKLRAM